MLASRGSGFPPTAACPAGTSFVSCPFCSRALVDLSCEHLFCPGCKVFQRVPPHLQWETAGGTKAAHSTLPGAAARAVGPGFGPGCNTRAGHSGAPRSPQGSSFDHPLAVGERKAPPHQGCPTSTCYGTMLDQAEPWLSGPKFFPITWAEAQAQPAESPLTGGSLVAGRSGALRSARCNALSAEAVSWGPGTEVVARRFGVDHSFAALEPTNPREQPAGFSLSPCRTRVFPSLGHGQVVPFPGPHTQPSACQEGTPACPPDGWAPFLLGRRHSHQPHQRRACGRHALASAP